MTNQDIRTLIKESGVKYWQIAERMNINDGNFSRKLRRELSQSEKDQITEIIRILKEGAENEWYIPDSRNVEFETG